MTLTKAKQKAILRTIERDLNALPVGTSTQDMKAAAQGIIDEFEPGLTIILIEKWDGDRRGFDVYIKLGEGADGR